MRGSHPTVRRAAKAGGWALVLALAACGDDDATGGSSANGSHFNSPSEIAGALTVAGIECNGYEDVEVGTEADETFGPDPRSAAGTCDNDGIELALEMFEDDAHAEQYRKQGDMLACSFGEAFGISQFSYAFGENWAAVSDDNLGDELHRQVAAELSGEFHKVEC
jgi:hypothetical protein